MKQIDSNLGMVIDSIELYILILDLETSPWFKATVMHESKNSCAVCFTYFLSDFDWIWYAFETCWFD